MPELIGPRLDPATLLFSTAVMGFVMAAFSFSAARTLSEQQRSLRTWGMAMAAAGTAFLLYFLRDHVPWLLSFIGGNLVMLAALLLVLRAQALLVGAQLPVRLLAVLAVWSLSGVLLASALGGRSDIGAVTMSSGFAALSLVFGHLMWRHEVARTLPAARFSALVAVGTALTFTWRTWVALSGRLPTINTAPSGGVSYSIVHAGSLVVGGLFLAAASVTFFSMVHELRRRETQDSARRDGLTGVLTRRAFFDAASHLLQTSPHTRYAIAMVDLDHFKSVNDRFGHLGGDQALAHMARLIAGAARNPDLVGRYGGEEFCVLLRDCGPQEAAGFGQRLVEQAASTTIRLADGQQLGCTLSAGIACSQPGESIDQVIARADEVLYAAKAQGRNRALTAL